MTQGFPSPVPTLSALTLLAAACVGCSSIPVGTTAHVGRYELRSVDGRTLPDDRLGGVIAGELVLTADGRVTRIVQHATSGVPGPIVRRASGTYRVRGAEITFDLEEELRPSGTRRWHVRGEARPPTIVLRYPGPGDRGVEEVYVRVTG
jgi:hypothetical protein